MSGWGSIGVRWVLWVQCGDNMHLKTKLVRDGNSWVIRLPKSVLQLSGLKGGSTVFLEIKRGRILIWFKQKDSQDDVFEQSRKDAKKAWDKAFEDVWRQVVGEDE